MIRKLSPESLANGFPWLDIDVSKPIFSNVEAIACAETSAVLLFIRHSGNFDILDISRVHKEGFFHVARSSQTGRIKQRFSTKKLYK